MGLRRRYALTVVLLAAYSLAYFHRAMTGVMEREVSELAREFGWDSQVLLSLLSSLYFYTYALSQFAVGSLVDFLGIGRVATPLLALMAFATLLMVTPSPPTLMLSRVLVGFSAAVAFLSYQRSLSLYYRRDEQVRATAVALVVGNVSAMLATYPLRLALDSLGLAYTSVALSAVTLAIALATAYVGLRVLVDPGSGGGYLSRTFRNLREILEDPHSWGVSVGALATYGTALSFQSSWGQLLLSRCFGLDRVTVSYYLMVLAAVFVVTSPIAGYVSDRVLRRKPLLLLSATSMAVSWTLLYASYTVGSTPAAALSLALLGASLGPHIVVSPMMREVRRPEAAATSIAFMNTVLFLGTALLNTVLPLLSPPQAVLVSLAVTSAGAVAVKALTRETVRTA